MAYHTRTVSASPEVATETGSSIHGVFWLYRFWYHVHCWSSMLSGLTNRESRVLELLPEVATVWIDSPIDVGLSTDAARDIHR